MVDPVDLPLFKNRREQSVQRDCRRQVVAKRFFNHDPDTLPVRSQLGFAHHMDNGFDDGRRYGQVENMVGRDIPFFFLGLQLLSQSCVDGWVGKIAWDICLLYTSDAADEE